MYDTSEIKQRYDLRAFIEQQLGKPAYRSTKTSSWKCPLHGETKGNSLVVYEDGWKCYGACQKHGDIISWLQEYEGISFETACQKLGATHQANYQPPRHQPEDQAPKPVISYAHPPSKEWQEFGWRLVIRAQAHLWAAHGKPTLDYLMTKRGLWDSVIKEAQLGLIPGKRNRYFEPFDGWHVEVDSEIKPVRVNPAIVIPHVYNDILWAIRLRPLYPGNGSKYRYVLGSRPMLYWSDHYKPGQPLLIDEGEFNALSTWQAGEDWLSSVALCSASYAQIDPHWWDVLLQAPYFFVRLDDDRAGTAATDKLMQLTNKARSIAMPHPYKDPNEFLTAEGTGKVFTWLHQADVNIQKGIVQYG